MFTRTLRGAANAKAFAEIQFSRLSRKLMGFRPQATALLKHSAFAVLAINVATTPVAVHATEAGAFAAADDEPSSTTAKVSPLSHVSFEPLSVGNTLATPTVSTLTLSTITPGESVESAEIRKAAESKAAEEAAARKAAADAESARIAAAIKAAVEKASARSLAVIAPDSSVASVGNYDELFEQYFGDDWKTAKAICTAESGLNPLTVSRTADYGLCQINQVHRGRVGGDLTKLFDPATNIRIAANIFHENGGWHPWTVYRTGAYKKFLNR